MDEAEKERKEFLLPFRKKLKMVVFPFSNKKKEEGKPNKKDLIEILEKEFL